LGSAYRCVRPARAVQTLASPLCPAPPRTGFDFPERAGDPVDAVQIEVPGISAQQLRDGLLADRAAAERLFGGSVTLDGRLVLIASFADVEVAKRFIAEIGGDLGAATIRTGHEEFVG
jgi:hypothetical protein